MRRSQTEKLETHERILDAAARQIRLGGPESLSIAGLMKAAALTHGGFYKHFSSRDALIRAAIRRAAQGGPDPFGAAGVTKAEAVVDRDAAAQAGPDSRGASDHSEGPDLPGSASVKTIVARYLSSQHRDNATSGCAIAALATDITRLDDAEAGLPVREKAERGFARMNAALGGGDAISDDALVAWCAMLGALTLSRVFKDDPRSEEILAAAKQHIVAMAEQAAKGRAQD